MAGGFYLGSHIELLNSLKSTHFSQNILKLAVKNEGGYKHRRAKAKTNLQRDVDPFLRFLQDYHHIGSLVRFRNQSADEAFHTQTARRATEQPKL